MGNEMIERVEVTQVDRDRAADVCMHVAGLREYFDAVKRGDGDGDFLVQSFARHRIAALA